ncbi:MAG: DUF2779 domain-containing protein, partial [Limnochordia bacterium]|nr:DUF2779 domain-containing protein [Limnochordia bacterium]
MQARYLTKSRFALALECPTKLNYEGKPEYADASLEDSFLQALADGGYQVGELAKCYVPDGVLVQAQDYQEAVDQTARLLQNKNVTIYEAAFGFGNLFARVDILVKQGSSIELIEVKAKSVRGTDENVFGTKRGAIRSKWYGTLCDVAFQKHVVQSSIGRSVQAYLMLVQKDAVCPTDGLNQKFRIGKDARGRRIVMVSPELSAEDLADPILTKISVERSLEQIHTSSLGEHGFFEFIERAAYHYVRDRRIAPILSPLCGTCQFRSTEGEQKAGKRSGFQECWAEVLGWQAEDFRDPTVLDIWGFRKKAQYIKAGRIKLLEIGEGDIEPERDGRPGLSTSERQWMQVKKVKEGDGTPWIDQENLRREIDSWVYPLHFIDFETAMVAIPFNKGRRPYEAIAFQYSHHTVDQDGQVTHRGQFLNSTPGQFPNYDFVRSLKRELENDHGSIFRYSSHENTFLCHIHDQLTKDPDDIPDRDSLCEFIRTITTCASDTEDTWEGPRQMVDLLELVRRYYYDPRTGGSNSIKHVLPAILSRSKQVQEKYSIPIYGARGGISSHNFKDFIWIKKDTQGQVIDPYTLLPKMFDDVSDKDYRLLDYDGIRDGGAALTAYARLQFEEMSAREREKIESALLKYCELDTFAMVMLFEAWLDLLG